MQAAGDYERFKMLMKIKNEQLHNEALEMLQKRRKERGETDVSAPTSMDDFSEEEIREAIRQSLAEHAAEREAKIAEKRDVERALAASVAGLLKSQAAQPEPPTNVEVSAAPSDDANSKSNNPLILGLINICIILKSSCKKRNRVFRIPKRSNGEELC